ncbi:MAG: VWA domain-containing protein [Legionellaceae bacterium]
MTFHFIRPLWLLLFIPLIYCGYLLYQEKKPLKAWSHICDAHLLPYLIRNQDVSQKAKKELSLRLTLGSLMILALAGPSFFNLPVPHYEPIHPHVLLLDLSPSMLKTDIKPNRLNRAKFKLHDLFLEKNTGLMGLIVYTEEPFVASPLTQDTKTIASLLDELTPEIMPIDGLRLDRALGEAQKLIQQSGSSHGDILVLTGEAPTARDFSYAKKLARQGTHVSILPFSTSSAHAKIFTAFSEQGHGSTLTLSNTATDIKAWLNQSKHHETFQASQNNDIPLWRDDGRFLLLPTLLLFLLLFRRDLPKRGKA